MPFVTSGQELNPTLLIPASAQHVLLHICFLLSPLFPRGQGRQKCPCESKGAAQPPVCCCSLQCLQSHAGLFTYDIAPAKHTLLSVLCLECISDQDTQSSKTLENFNNNNINKKFPFYQLLLLLRPMVLVMEYR